MLNNNFNFNEIYFSINFAQNINSTAENKIHDFKIWIFYFIKIRFINNNHYS